LVLLEEKKPKTQKDGRIKLSFYDMNQKEKQNC